MMSVLIRVLAASNSFQFKVPEEVLRSAKVKVIEILLQIWASDGHVLSMQSQICRWLAVSMGVVQWTKESSRSKTVMDSRLWD
jgi:hypothetical protein